MHVFVYHSKLSTKWLIELSSCISFWPFGSSCWWWWWRPIDKQVLMDFQFPKIYRIVIIFINARGYNRFLSRQCATQKRNRHTVHLLHFEMHLRYGAIPNRTILFHNYDNTRSTFAMNNFKLLCTILGDAGQID